MNFFGAIALFTGGMLTGFLLFCWMLHRSHHNFISAFTDPPKGK